MPDMGIPTTVMFRVVVVAVFTLSTAAAAGNATASPSSVTNSTASSTKNTTAPLLPPFGTNHAVGDGAGWIFDWKANASAANYSAWAANRTFFLGDYLSESSSSASSPAQVQTTVSVWSSIERRWLRTDVSDVCGGMLHPSQRL